MGLVWESAPALWGQQGESILHATYGNGFHPHHLHPMRTWFLEGTASVPPNPMPFKPTLDLFSAWLKTPFIEPPRIVKS